MKVGTKCSVCEKPLGPGTYAAQVRFGILEDFGGELDFDDVEPIVDKVVCGACFIITLNMLASNAKKRSK